MPKNNLGKCLNLRIAVVSEGSKSSTHYLGDKNRFDVSSKGHFVGNYSSGTLIPDEGPLLETWNIICFYRLGSE